MGPGDHVFFLYDGEEEHRALLTPYLRQGLERREKVIYIADAHPPETILGYLRGDGVEVEPYLDSGQLAVLPAEEVYTRGGAFDPDRVMELLQSKTELALAEGYSALRATGEVAWALRGVSGSERLLEYEAKVNRLFPGSRLLGLCQYDRRLFGPSMLLDAGLTHPKALIGKELCTNTYYLHPEEFLDSVSEAKLRMWIDHTLEKNSKN